MANVKNRYYAFALHDVYDMLPIFGSNVSSAMPIDTCDITPRRLNSGFIVMAHGSSVPISWEGPPILQRMNR